MKTGFSLQISARRFQKLGLKDWSLGLRVLLLTFTFVLFTVSFADVPADWPNPFEMTATPIDFTPPEPQSFLLDNGIEVFISEDHTLPFIDGVAYVKASSLYDPVDKVGLAGLTASMLREGGAGDLTPDEVNARLEFLAASVEASANEFFASLGFSTLSENIDEVFAIWLDTLMRPSFDAGRLEVQRQRILEGIRRENDDPFAIAQREFFAKLAEGHPSGYVTTEATTNAITRDDLVNFHQTYFQPAGISIAITGDFNTDEMLTKLNATLGQWQGQAVVYPEIPAFNFNPAPKIYFAQKDLEQSVILMGHPSVLAYSPEYNDLMVANDILGAGGFSSRFFLEIRTRRGLAYQTGTGLSQGFSYPGLFYGISVSRADKTAEVIDLMRSEIRRLQAEGVTAEELKRSQDSILNSSLFRFTSLAAVTARTARVKLLGLEPGYYETFLQDVQAITQDEVQAIAQSQLRPDDLIIMVVGDAAKFDRPLSELGEVIEIALE
jgi:predicted Zn-dependent peptidase